MTTQDRAFVAQRAAAALAARFRGPRWKPLPHQIPPPGDWYGWLLLAGRGAGKTDACAHYVAQHVAGPACLPGPVPHWIGIVGPTQGDAVTACINGPSGLKAHDPTVKGPTAAAGGTVVRWPNGSQAKIFGAHSAEDVERLRAGGNTCVAEGTLVRTEHGLRPIEDIRPGELVWTRNGLRRVLRTWDNGIKEVQRFDHAAGTVWLTPDHAVWTTGRGWREAQFVSPADTVLTWENTEKGRTGTARVARPPGPASNPAPSPASVAARPSSPAASPSGCGTAPPLAATLRHEHGSDGCAACAALTSNARPAMRPAPARASTLRSTPTRNEARVYDLTVEHDHEFFAGDLLVSNCIVWMEELAAWRYLDAAWDQIRFGLRSGARPHWIASTTPKPKPLIKALAAGTIAMVARTHATMYDNPHLPAHIREALEDTYKDTQIGDQELYGKLLDEEENALWNHQMIRNARVAPDALPDLVRITVGVDPSGGAGEQGIVVAGKSALLPPHFYGVPPAVQAELVVQASAAGAPRPHRHGYVLDDRTCHLPPDGWGRRAVQAAIDWEADDLVVERNFGGDMAIATIRAAAEHMGVDIPVRQVIASRGKAVRAQPVAALTSQRRWHHAGTFEALENQLCTWYQELEWSPDRLDAMVWTAWHNKLARLTVAGKGSLGGQAARQQIAGAGLRSRP